MKLFDEFVGAVEEVVVVGGVARGGRGRGVYIRGFGVLLGFLGFVLRLLEALRLLVALLASVVARCSRRVVGWIALVGGLGVDGGSLVVGRV